MMWEVLFQPFYDYGFMRRALYGCIAISIGSTPVGVFLMLRRMSLTGDAMAMEGVGGATAPGGIFQSQREQCNGLSPFFAQPDANKTVVVNLASMVDFISKYKDSHNQIILND